MVSPPTGSPPTGSRSTVVFAKATASHQIYLWSQWTGSWNIQSIRVSLVLQLVRRYSLTWTMQTTWPFSLRYWKCCFCHWAWWMKRRNRWDCTSTGRKQRSSKLVNHVTASHIWWWPARMWRSRTPLSVLEAWWTRGEEATLKSAVILKSPQAVWLCSIGISGDHQSHLTRRSGSTGPTSFHSCSMVWRPVQQRRSCVDE